MSRSLISVYLVDIRAMDHVGLMNLKLILFWLITIQGRESCLVDFIQKELLLVLLLICHMETPVSSVKVCVCVCVHACVCACVRAYVGMCMHVYVHVWRCLCQ